MFDARVTEGERRRTRLRDRDLATEGQKMQNQTEQKKDSYLDRLDDELDRERDELNENNADAIRLTFDREGFTWKTNEKTRYRNVLEQLQMNDDADDFVI